MKGERRSGYFVPKSDRNERQSKHHGQADEESDHRFHPGDGDRSCLQSVRFPSVLVRIRTFERITQFIGQITENLERQCGTDSQCKNPPVRMETARQTGA